MFFWGGQRKRVWNFPLWVVLPTCNAIDNNIKKNRGAVDEIFVIYKQKCTATTTTITLFSSDRMILTYTGRRCHYPPWGSVQCIQQGNVSYLVSGCVLQKKKTTSSAYYYYSIRESFYGIIIVRRRYSPITTLPPRVITIVPGLQSHQPVSQPANE